MKGLMKSIVSETAKIFHFRHKTEEHVKVNVIGYVNGNMGLSVLARSIVNGLLCRNISVSIIDLEPGYDRGGHDQGYRHLMTDTAVEGINLFVVNPLSIKELQSLRPDLFATENFLVGLCMWELPRLPASWVTALSVLDVVLAGSEFIRYAFSFCLPSIQSLVYKHPLYIPENIRSDRSIYGFKPDDVVYFTGFEPYSDIVRKNTVSTLQTFLKSLGHQDSAHLIVKVNNAFLNQEPHPDYKMLLDIANEHTRVHFITESLSYDRLMSLYASCDVFISLHRSEGLGLIMMEAMMLGKPVIATAWSGNMSFMNHTNACLVGYRLIDANGTLECYQKNNIGDGAVWAEPDLTEAELWMMRLFNDPDLRKKIGEKALADITQYQNEARKCAFFDELLALFENKKIKDQYESKEHIAFLSLSEQ